MKAVGIGSSIAGEVRYTANDTHEKTSRTRGEKGQRDCARK